jgi:uncharacterized SAM-binding protein YcdF (DUF218 family)
MRKILFAVGFYALFNFIAVLVSSNLYFEHIFLGLVAIALIVYASVYNRFSRRFHRRLIYLCLIPVAFSGFLAAYGKTSSADFTEDAVIVLGAGLRGDGVPGAHLARRLDAAITYLNENPNAIVVTSGGMDENHYISEAEAMANYLTRRGISPERILQEDRSTSTFENLTFSDEILAEYFPDGYRAVVVSNYFHLYRAVRVARNIGIDAVHYGAPTPRRSFAANYMREIVAVTYYWIFD